MKQLKILICPDSFKGTLTSQEASNAIEKGILETTTDAKITKLPIADGGEGTVDVLIRALNGKKKQIQTVDPLGRRISATIGVCKKRNVLILEAAQANGITLLKPKELNPFKASSFGIGLMLKKALEQYIPYSPPLHRGGVRGGVSHETQLLIGLGGSCTNDGGIGLAQALGYELLDKRGKPLVKNGQTVNVTDISRLHIIQTTNLPRHGGGCQLTILTDVSNLLLGPTGATYTFAKQKGAKPADLPKLEALLQKLRDVVLRDLDIDMNAIKGAGAAGGLGAALVAFCGATIKPGMEEIAKLTQLEDHIKNSDLVITGEGKIDAQTEFEKGPYTIAKLAKKHGKKVIALCGVAERKPAVFDAVYATADLPNFDPSRIKQNAKKFLTQLAHQAITTSHHPLHR